ncbi:MAG: helix-turn-helix domain-containing protein [Ideonella sp.]|nr:helix-turn-helix domain-containing protein [Ideonella sp.]
MAGLHVPLSTLHVVPRDRPRMTRGQHGSLYLCCEGLAPFAPCRSPGAPEADLDLGRTERRLIQTAMARTDGNVTHAARLLGISRDTLRYRLERLGLGDTH